MTLYFTNPAKCIVRLLDLSLGGRLHAFGGSIFRWMPGSPPTSIGGSDPDWRQICYGLPKMKNEYQIVVQWDTESMADFDLFIGIEELLYEKLSSSHRVDGHDAGSGEVNIFIITGSPQAAIEEIKTVLSGQAYWLKARVAYRPVLGMSL